MYTTTMGYMMRYSYIRGNERINKKIECVEEIESWLHKTIQSAMEIEFLINILY